MSSEPQIWQKFQQQIGSKYPEHVGQIGSKYPEHVGCMYNCVWTISVILSTSHLKIIVIRHSYLYR